MCIIYMYLTTCIMYIRYVGASHQQAKKVDLEHAG